jgi:hypothetical protein
MVAKADFFKRRHRAADGSTSRNSKRVCHFLSCWSFDFFPSHVETQIDFPVRHTHTTLRLPQREEAMQARMQQAYLFAVVTVALVVVRGGTALAQSSNPHIGPWKMNVAKTKFNPGPAPKSSTTKIEAGAGVKYTVDQVSADGTALHWEFSGNYDGKDNAVTGKNPNSDMVALTRVNPTTVTLLNKMGGKSRSLRPPLYPVMERQGPSRPRGRTPKGKPSTTSRSTTDSRQLS